jgi:hypothetical protein
MVRTFNCPLLAGERLIQAQRLKLVWMHTGVENNCHNT